MEKFLNRQLDKIQLDLTQDKNVCFSKKKMIKFKLTSRRYIHRTKSGILSRSNWI